MKNRYRQALSRERLSIIALTLSAGFALPGVAAEEATFRQTAGEYSIYLAVMPRELITGPAAVESDRTRIFQQAAARDTHHLMVSIFESRSGRRITDAAVAARVAGLGFSGEKKTLMPTALAGSVLYTGLFPMIERGPFRIDVEFRVPSTVQLGQVTFYFTHPQFTARTTDAREQGQ